MYLSYPRDNSSAKCLSDLDCFGNQTCYSSRHANYNVCDCYGYMDPMTRCQRNLFHVLDGQEIIYLALGYVTYGFIFIILLLEIFIDVKLRSLKFLLLPKITLIIFTIFRLAHFSLWAYSSNYGQVDSLILVDTILRTIGIIFLGSVTYLKVCLAWSDILLKARNFGEQNYLMPILRKVLIGACIIVNCVAIPAHIYGNVVNNNAIVNLANSIDVIGLAIAISITSYLLIVVYRWFRKLAEGDFRSKRTRQILNKTRWLIGMNCNLGFMIIIIIASINSPKELPHVMLIIESISRIIEILSCVCLIGFLESYLTLYPDKPFLGYVRGVFGHISISDTQHNKSDKTIKDNVKVRSQISEVS